MVLEHPGSGSDPLIGSGPKRGATERATMTSSSGSYKSSSSNKVESAIRASMEGGDGASTTGEG